MSRASMRDLPVVVRVNDGNRLHDDGDRSPGIRINREYA
jgi:hypothetical protein